eukprot:COSAG01_NODE_158_length_23708_cov_7.921979_7_plen_422_part_00
MPQQELERAAEAIRRCKRRVRSCLSELCTMAHTQLRPIQGADRTCTPAPTSPPTCQAAATSKGGAQEKVASAARPTAVATSDGSEGYGDDGIDESEIVCSACCSAAATEANDIVLCDAPGCKLAFHFSCCIPKLTAAAFGALPEEEEWWCPPCNTMYNCTVMINEVCDRDYSPVLSEWPAIFSEVSEEEQHPNKPTDGTKSTGISGDREHTLIMPSSNAAAGDELPESDSDDQSFDGSDSEESDSDDKAIGGPELEDMKSRLQQHDSEESDVELDEHDEEESEVQPEACADGSDGSDGSDDDDDEEDEQQQEQEEPDHEDEEEERAHPAGAAASTDGPKALVDGSSDDGDGELLRGPRGRGHRKRSGVNYTCLDILMFGLPSDDKNPAVTSNSDGAGLAKPREEAKTMSEEEEADSDWESE